MRKSKLGGGSIGDADVVVVDVGSMQFTKSYVVGLVLLLVGAGGLRSWPLSLELEKDDVRARVDPSFASLRGAEMGLSSLSSACAALLEDAIGNDNPRSLPLLATPTPHVKVVLYPEQSFPWSRQGVQYGRRLSHLVWRS